MRSMTGFGRAERGAEGIAVSLQVSSVNRKNLEVFCTLPKEFQRLERRVVEAVRQRAARGRFQFSVEIRNEGVEGSGLPDDDQMDAALSRLHEFAARHEAPLKIDGHLLVSLASLLDADAAHLPEELVDELLFQALDTAMSDLVAMREKEGVALLADLRERAKRMQDLVTQVRELAPQMVDKHRENLLARLEQAGLEIDIDDERVLKEIALFADRCDITEELTRLASHFEQFQELLGREEPVGRPLEFLAQEIGREINTAGSKTCVIEISRLVMEMKSEMERIREQVANVE